MLSLAERRLHADLNREESGRWPRRLEGSTQCSRSRRRPYFLGLHVKRPRHLGQGIAKRNFIESERHQDCARRIAVGFRFGLHVGQVAGGHLDDFSPSLERFQGPRVHLDPFGGKDRGR